MKVDERILHIVRLFQCKFSCYSKIKVFMIIVKARPKIVLLWEVQMNASRLAPVSKKSNNS